jgi:hypothetical protein
MHPAQPGVLHSQNVCTEHTTMQQKQTCVCTCNVTGVLTILKKCTQRSRACCVPRMYVQDIQPCNRKKTGVCTCNVTGVLTILKNCTQRSRACCVPRMYAQNILPYNRNELVCARVMSQVYEASCDAASAAGSAAFPELMKSLQVSLRDTCSGSQVHIQGQTEVGLSVQFVCAYGHCLMLTRLC